MNLEDTILLNYVSIYFNLSQGGSTWDRLKVSGEDEQWVRSIFVEISDIIESVASSTSFITKHPILCGYLVYLGWGFLVNSFIRLSIQFLSKYFVQESFIESIDITALKKSFLVNFFSLPTVYIPLEWLFRLFAGFFCGGFLIHEWLEGAWPTIELDVGPNHLKSAKKRRHHISFFVVVILIPLIIAIIYDVYKAFY